MEKIEKKYKIVYRHVTTYRGEDIGVRIHDKKNKDYIYVKVYTPIREEYISKARFYKSEKVSTMREAKRVSRTFITEATTDIDRHLTELEDLDEFFESVDESVESLEGKFDVIEEEFARELERI